MTAAEKKAAAGAAAAEKTTEQGAEQTADRTTEATAEAKRLLKHYGLKRAALAKGELHFEESYIKRLEEAGEELTIITA